MGWWKDRSEHFRARNDGKVLVEDRIYEAGKKRAKRKNALDLSLENFVK